MPGDDCAAPTNVDTCALVLGTNRCVCNDFEDAVGKRACPMALTCVQGGCEYESIAYATMDALLDAINGDAGP
jgi:hypothetical protein